MLSIYVAEDEISHAWESVWLMEHVIDESVNLHVVSDVASTVGDQHVAVGVFDGVRKVRKCFLHHLKSPSSRKHYREGGPKRLLVGMTDRSTLEAFCT